ncbi:GNAT family N-acetyltransferase [Enterovibrio norvegicus]|uniref:GNAT family N-acetyltransferase n=1 Tax=Enterovibrio norvegicus TaxID=188144 RepID=A0A2N7L384_9GAMM|nr:GNAT family N-acetyltransferase [Enterovibrio norvegicus]PMN74152.1 GNAT family N-acetyltransferase [Enterovibrio norvegicus]PMN87395.1 GNAT family N-acetyltransferase [Enterovibrio norvegicus]
MYTIRQATKDDVNRMAQIEAVCFSEAEAAPLASFQKRFAAFPECFFVLEVDDVVVGHINGCIYSKPELPDVLYSDPSLHCPDGAYQTVFGLAIDPQHQKKGYASVLTKHFIDVSRANNREGIVLTCKDHLVKFYQSLGFSLKGVSASSHGGAKWNDMVLTF